MTRRRLDAACALVDADNVRVRFQSELCHNRVAQRTDLVLALRPSVGFRRVMPEMEVVKAPVERGPVLLQAIVDVGDRLNEVFALQCLHAA